MPLTCGRFTAEVCAALHRGRDDRAAPAGHGGAARALLTRDRHRPDHRADPARPGRAGHAVRPRPGRRQRPPDRGGRHPGRGQLVRRRPRRRRSRPGRARPGRGVVRPLPRGPRPDPGSRRSPTPCSPACARGANTPTRRAPPARARPTPASPPRRRPPGRRRAARGARGDPCRPRAGRRRPGGDHSLPGLGSAALGAVGRAARRRSSGALPGPGRRSSPPPRSAQPLTLAGRAARCGSRCARVPGRPAPADAVLFAGTSEVAADGTRTLLGSAVAPLRVPVPADADARSSHGDLPGVVAPVEAGHRARGRGRDHRPGLRGGDRARGAAGRRWPATGCPCRLVPGESARRTPCRRSPRSGSGVLLAWLARRGARRGAPAPPARRPRPSPTPTRCRCASPTSPRPTRAGSAP